MNLKVVTDLFCQIPISSLIVRSLIFDRTQLSDAKESLLSDYLMVIDYTLEINLTKCQNIKNDFIHF